MRSRSKLLICVNDSTHAEAALRFACLKASKQQAPLELLHVIEYDEHQHFLAISEIIQSEKRQTAEALLQQFAEAVHQQTGMIPSVTIREGKVGEEILAAIQEDDSFKMLILGSAAESTQRHALLPWLASHLGKKILIPLLIVPNNLTEEQMRELV